MYNENSANKIIDTIESCTRSDQLQAAMNWINEVVNCEEMREALIETCNQKERELSPGVLYRDL